MTILSIHMPRLIFSWFIALMPGPEHTGIKTYCTFSLDSCPSSLAALKMSWVPWKRQNETDRREAEGRREGEEESIVIIMTMQGSSKRLSVTQRTVTFLTHTFINSHSKPLYRCQGTFSFKCCYHTYLCFIHSKTLHSAARTHTHWDISVRKEGKVAQLVVRARKKTFSCTHEHTHTHVAAMRFHFIVRRYLLEVQPNAILW